MAVEISRRTMGALAVVMAGAVAACAPPVGTGDGGVNRCTTDATNSCACIDGTMGTQRCRANGTYGECVCGAADGGVDAPIPADHALTDTGTDVSSSVDVRSVDAGVDTMDVTIADVTSDVGALDVPQDNV
jgi:hypothetical protein